MSNGKSILLIDDEDDFRQIFRTKLEASGFRVETATGGKEGIEKAKQYHPDLILLDVQMPDMDGSTTLLKLQEEPECRDARVMFLTALGDPRFEAQEVNRRLAKEIGAIGYLKKEGDLDKTINYIKSILQ